MARVVDEQKLLKVAKDKSECAFDKDKDKDPEDKSECAADKGKDKDFKDKSAGAFTDKDKDLIDKSECAAASKDKDFMDEERNVAADKDAATMDEEEFDALRLPSGATAMTASIRLSTWEEDEDAFPNDQDEDDEENATDTNLGCITRKTRKPRC